MVTDDEDKTGRRRSTAPIWLATAVVLLGVYLISYRALQHEVAVAGRIYFVYSVQSKVTFNPGPEDDDLWEFIFMPVYWMDSALRARLGLTERVHHGGGVFKK